MMEVWGKGARALASVTGTGSTNRRALGLFTGLVLGLIVGLSPAQASSRATTSPSSKALYLGGGLISYNSLTTTSSLRGEVDLFGEPYLPINLQFFLPLKAGWQLAPRLNASLLGGQLKDGAGQSFIAYFSLPFTKTFYQGQNTQNQSVRWDWSTGPALWQQTLVGRGGTVTLNDGTGMQTFYRPSGTSRAQMLLWHLGLGYSLNQWRMDMELALNWPSSERQTQHLMFLLSYQLWESQ